jgi:aspartate kinase
MIVMKFGGTSVEDAVAIDRSCGIVAERISRKPLVVVSALAGTTNGLLQAANLAGDRKLEQALEIITPLERRHAELLPATAREFTALRELLRAIDAIGEFSARSRDLVAAYGEVLSSRIFTERLKRHGVNAKHIDARECIITDDSYGSAHPMFGIIHDKLQQHARPYLEAGQVVVMGGFIGSTSSGITTTLGRGASDYSAAIAGAALDAEEIQIWTDVDGLMTTDPRIVSNAWKVKETSFAEASELAYFGAKVLHPATVLPAVEKNIPVYILNSRRPAGTGTRITQDAVPCRNLIKAIAVKRGITVVTVSSSRMLMAHGFLRALFEVFDRHRASVDMIATSEVSVSLSLDNNTVLPGVVEDLKKLGDVKVDENLALLCLVGANLKYTPGVAAEVFNSIRDINVLMVSHGASNINLSFMIDQKNAEAAVRKLHAYFFREFDPAVFEPPMVTQAAL